MRDDFAVFILSHGRAKEISTNDALKNAGYTGKTYIIVDDLDDQLSDYKERFGEQVIVFDKKAWAEKTDTVTSTSELRPVVFARNACYSIAENLGIKFFTEFDDDLMTFMFRYDENGSLKSKKISEMDSVFDAMIEFQEQAGLVSLGIACDAGMIGGVNGNFRKKLLRSIHQAFILRTDMPIEFKGILNEDGIATALCSHTGRLAFEYTGICQTCPARSTNNGGLSDLYRANDEYVRAFYTIIAVPSSQKIYVRNSHVTLKSSSDCSYPRIINERWKK